MDYIDVPMLKIWPILANTDTDINIGASLMTTKQRLQVERILHHCKEIYLC